MKRINLTHVVAQMVLVANLCWIGCEQALEPDTVPPVISGIASSVGDTTTTITWRTDEPATSQVEYGISAEYGTLTPLDTMLVVEHSVTLSGLERGQTYHYRAKSQDEHENLSVSDDFTFATSAPPADLVLNVHVTPEYESYLAEKEREFRQSHELKDHIGLAVVKLGQIQVEVDKIADDFEDLGSDIEAQADSIAAIVEDEISPIGTESVESFTGDVKALFIDPKFTEVKERVERVGDFFQDELQDRIDELDRKLGDLGETVEGKLDTVYDELDFVYHNFEGTDFEFQFDVEGNDRKVILISDENFQNVRSIADYLESGFDQLQDAVDVLQEKYDSGQYAYADSDREDLTNALDRLLDGLAEIESGLRMEPLAQLEVDTGFVDDLRSFVEDLKRVVNGVSFDFEEKSIRPAGWIENPPDEEDLERFVVDFYASEDREAYTFGGLFPEGLPENILRVVEPDLVIDLNADTEQMRAYLDRRLTDMMTVLIGKEDADAHFGVALIKTYKLLDEHFEDFEDMLNLVAEGNLTEFNAKYDLEDYDFSTTLDSIRIHLDRAEQERDLAFLIVVVDRDFSPGDPFRVYPYPLDKIHYLNAQFMSPLDVKVINGMLDALEVIGEAAKARIHELLDKLLVDDTSDLLQFVKDMLNREAFQFEDGKTIQPSAWIEHPPQDIDQLIVDFYAQEPDERPAYDFAGLFPQGLPEEFYSAVKPDLVLISNASREELRTYLDGMLAQFEDDLVGSPDDPDANLGVALIKAYDLFDDNVDDFIDMMDYIGRGDFAGLYEQYDLDDYDFQTTLDSIRTHLDVAREDRDLCFMIVLAEREADFDHTFTVRVDDSVVPCPITKLHLDILDGIADGLEEVGEVVERNVEHFLSNLDEVFVIDLDPNTLDFSESESPKDFIDALLKSNSEFSSLTPDAEERMREIGDNITSSLERASEDMARIKDLVNQITVHQEDLGIDGEEWDNAVSELDSIITVLLEDFQVPEKTTKLGGREINLSAWFDNPPENLLGMIRDYLDEDANTDDTLGGLLGPHD